MVIFSAANGMNKVEVYRVRVKCLPHGLAIASQTMSILFSNELLILYSIVACGPLKRTRNLKSLDNTDRKQVKLPLNSAAIICKEGHLGSKFSSH